jgi:hypothetical protein
MATVMLGLFHPSNLHHASASRTIYDINSHIQITGLPWMPISQPLLPHVY